MKNWWLTTRQLTSSPTSLQRQMADKCHGTGKRTSRRPSRTILIRLGNLWWTRRLLWQNSILLWLHCNWEKSPGPDNITDKTLLHLGPGAKKKLLQLINDSWRTDIVPQIWKNPPWCMCTGQGKTRQSLTATVLSADQHVQAYRTPHRHHSCGTLK